MPIRWKPRHSLNQAEIDLRKLQLQPGMRVLDIGAAAGAACRNIWRPHYGVAWWA